MNSKNKIILAVVAILAVAAIIALGVKNQMKQHSGDDENVIKIGAIIFLTGPQAASGKDVLEGLQIALKEINTQNRLNGKTIKLIVEDSKDSPKEAITAFHKLESENCAAIICAGDVVAFTLAPLAEKNEIPLVTVVAEASNIPQLSKWVHRVWIPDHLLISTISKYLAEDLKAKEIVVFSINNEFGLSSSKDFETKIAKLGASKVVALQYYGIADKDVKSQVAKGLASQPDTAFVIGFGEGFGSVINALKEFGFNGIVCSSVTMAVDYYQKQTEKSNEGVIFPAPPLFSIETNDLSRTFIQAFTEQMKHEPSFTSAFAYESLNFVVSSILLRGNSREQIQDGLQNLPVQETVFGEISYDQNGEVIMPTAVFKMKNGMPVLIKKYAP